MNAPSPDVTDRIGLEKLASLPQAAIHLLQACNDPDTEFDALTRIIGQDAGLTAKMLQVANSPLYAQWGEIKDLNRMLVVLGFNTIRTVAATSSVLEFFAQIGPGHERHLRQMWYRTLHCALLARRLAQQTAHSRPDELYLAGLLHKIGQLVMLNHAPEVYEQLLNTHPDPAGLAAPEAAEFGSSHAELGAWLVEHWGLGQDLGDAILFQNEPAAKLQDAGLGLKLLNHAARLSGGEAAPSALQDTQRLSGLNEEQLSTLLKEVDEEVRSTAQSLGVEVEQPAASTTPPSPQQIKREAVIRNTAMVDSVKAAMWAEYPARIPETIIHTFFSVLFGLGGGMMFLQDPKGRLQGVPATERDQWLKEIHIELSPGRSLVADALLRGRAITSFEYTQEQGPLSVLDRQLTRRCGRGGLLALPLLSGGEKPGIFVAGIDRSTFTSLTPLKDILGLFCKEAANLLLRRRQDHQHSADLQAEMQAATQLNARKIRHEINNPLGIINNYLHILGAKLGDDNPVQRELDVVKSEIERVSNILLGLTDRITQSDIQAGRTDMNTTIQTLLSVLRLSLFEVNGIEVETDLERNLPTLNCEQDKLKQVLINLLKNAAEALQEGGSIRISTRKGVLSEGGRWVELRIQDNGPGLPEQIQSKIFQPVISTKGGDHSGLGLSITAQLIKEMKGRIHCRTNFSGTEFLILVPN